MNIIEYKNLIVSFKNGNNDKIIAVNDISFSLNSGEILGIVGESGCGKSVTAMSMMKLINEPIGKIESGEILFHGIDLTKLSESEIEKYRGKKIAAIYQDPLTSLNPVYQIGKQIVECIVRHRNLNKIESKKIAIELLTDVGIYSPEKIFNSYPNELSGGMRQRIVIAMALACNPEILIADEPTTSLDVTIQAEILELIKNIRKKYNMAILVITHDFGIVAELCDKVIVMYSGKIVEKGDVFEIFDTPKHPYTRALLSSKPSLDLEFSGIKKLETIKGDVPTDAFKLNNCYFLDRCTSCTEICRRSEVPKMISINAKHSVACHLCKEEI